MIGSTENERALAHIKMFLDYEVCNSWLTLLPTGKWYDELIAKYFAWKVRRKYDKYIEHFRTIAS